MKNLRHLTLGTTPFATSLVCATLIFTALGFTKPPSVIAQENNGPSTNVAWTKQTLNLLKSGDPKRGEKLNNKLECTSCHGKQGVSTNQAWPSLSGQPAGYIFKVLKDYQDKKLTRTDRGQLMTFIVEELTDQNIVDMASYFASQPLIASEPKSVQKLAEKLDTLGDPKRMIPPCSVCHGNNAKGSFPDMPALAGQLPDYLSRTLRNFRSGKRGNDVYSRMRLVAKRLTDKEIESLAAYYASIGAAAKETKVAKE